MQNFFVIKNIIAKDMPKMDGGDDMK